MSKYTTELRYICEVLADLDESEGFNSVDDIIDASYSKLFDFDYPIFDTDYKPTLEKKIIRHFYTREIGDETVGLFKMHLSAKMNDIMPYYNQLYESQLLEFEPLTDVNYTKSGSESLSASEITSNSLSTSEYNSTSEFHSNSAWDMYQDTPQNQLSGVESLEYLTNATLDKEHGVSASQQNNNIATVGRGNLDRTDFKRYFEKFEGYRNNNPSKLLSDYRETFLNIDLMIIGELEKLFFQLW